MIFHENVVNHVMPREGTIRIKESNWMPLKKTLQRKRWHDTAEVERTTSQLLLIVYNKQYFKV